MDFLCFYGLPCVCVCVCLCIRTCFEGIMAMLVVHLYSVKKIGAKFFFKYDNLPIGFSDWADALIRITESREE